MTPEDFRRLLVREGLVADSALPLLDEGDSSPWFVRLLAGAGAWLAALFLYGAIAAVAWPLLGSAPARLIVGLVACAGCALATRLRPEPAGVFLSQLLLATSLAGFLLVLAGASEWAGLMKVSLLAALLAAILLPANPEPIHRQAMALTLVAALAVAATDLGGLEPLGLLLAAAALLLWTTQARWAAAARAPIVVPLATAVTAGVVLVPALATDPLVRLGAERVAWPSWLMPAGLGVLLVAAVLIVARDLRAGASGAGTPAWLPWTALAATAAVTAATYSAPGVLACLLAWLLAMAAGRGALAGLALVALGWYLVRLYYGLETSLLGKGLALMATGAVLVCLQFGLRRLSRPPGLAATAGDIHA